MAKKPKSPNWDRPDLKNPKSPNHQLGVHPVPNTLPERRYVTVGEAYNILHEWTNAKPAQIRLFLDLYGKYGSKNISHLARETGIHRNTITRWIARLEEADISFYKPLNKSVIPLTDIASEADINAGRLKAEHIERVIDRFIAQASESGDQQALVTLIGAKDKIRSLRDDVPEVEIDIERRLGKDGLAGIDAKLATQLRLIAKHRDRLPESSAVLAELGPLLTDSLPSELPGPQVDGNSENEALDT